MWEVTFGNFLNMGMMIVAVTGSFYAMRNYMEKSVALLNLRATVMEAQLVKMDMKLEKYGETLIMLATQETRIGNMEASIADQRTRLTELEMRVNRQQFSHAPA